MAFGITPGHTQEISFGTLSAEQILVVGLETVKKLNWNIGHSGVSGFTAYTRFSWTSYGEEVTVKMQDDKVIIKSECTGLQMMDWGKNKANVEKFIRSFKQNAETLSPEEVATKYQALVLDTTTERDAPSQSPQAGRGKIKNFLSLFIPVEGYFITPVIVIINVLIFVLMIATGVHIMLPDNESLLLWGANFRPATLEQGWRLFTSCFLHIGIIHLLMNMYALVYVGILLEPLLGRARFLSAYLLTGIVGSAVSLYWHDYTISAGASGAIFGMYGVFFAMLTTNLIEKSARKNFMTSILIFISYNLLNGMRGGIDNAAHIGGLASGLVIGYAFYPGLIKPGPVNRKYISISLVTALTILASFGLYSQTSNDVNLWRQKIERFAILESEALEVYGMDETKPHEMLAAIKERGIPNWEESIRIITEADALNIPDEIHERNRKLLEYCQLRLKTFELMYKILGEDTDIYQSELESYNRRITTIITELGGA